MPFSWTMPEVISFILIYSPILAVILLVKGQVHETLLRVKEIAKNQYSKKESDELFFQQVRNEMANFKSEDVEQLSHCKNHGTLIQTMLSEQRAQKISQDYLADLIRDVKQSLDTNTKAIAENAQTNAALLSFLKEERMRR